MAEITTFGMGLKRRRQQRGLTQDDLAERVGCATQTIRKIEGGRRRPSYQMANRLAQVLELAPGELAAWMRAAREMPDSEDAIPTAEAPQPLAQVPPLPIYLTPFVGRWHEQADLVRLLQTPDGRLVTLLGPGGIGKTRLAVEVARQIEDFPDGVAFVPLAPVAAGSAIVPAIGDALGFTFSGPTDLAAQLVQHLRDQQALLILDNLEHLLDPEGKTLELIELLLRQAPRVTLLITSRERLKLAGVWAIEIEGLAVPPAGATHQPDAYPALELFVEHAQRVQHNFRLTPENEAAVATVCRLVGGMPLGIELAAAWVRMLSPEEIGQELMRDLEAQPASPDRSPERHHSLRSVVDHSWHLLAPVERQALGRLSVFGGGFVRAAAAEVAGAGLPVLASLADKSLLRRTPAGRYDLHEIIHQYAEARLREDPNEQAATRDRHADYYASWLANREHAVKGAKQAAALAEISAEIDNIRAAGQWALGQRRLGDLRRGAETLQWFYEFRSWYAEGAAVFDQAIAALRVMPHVDSDAELRRTFGQFLGHYSYLASRVGALEQACAAVEQSRALLATGGDKVTLSRTYIYQGMVAMQMGDYDMASQALASGLEIAERDDIWTIALAETWGSMLAHALGDYAEAERLFRAGLAHYRAIGNPRSLVFCLTFCSTTLMVLGKTHEAQALLRESLMLASAAEDRFGMAITLQHLGHLALEQHDAPEAVYLFREALDLMRATGSRWDIARLLNQYGAALCAVGDSARAIATYREALTTALDAQAIPDALQSLAGVAAQLHHTGRYAEAFGLCARIIADPASRIDTRDQATRLYATLMPLVPADQVAAIERQAYEQPLEHWSRIRL